MYKQDMEESQLGYAGKVSQVTDEMEKDSKVDTSQTAEDQAMLAFSYQMPGNEGEVQTVQVDQNKVEEEKEA